MKTEGLLAVAVYLEFLSTYALILILDFIIEEEKKERGRFFNVIIKIGLLREKSPPVITMVIWMILTIILLILSLITIATLSEKLNLINLSMIIVVVVVIALYIRRRMKKKS